MAEADQKVLENGALITEIQHLESLIQKLGEFKADLTSLPRCEYVSTLKRSSLSDTTNDDSWTKAEKRVHFSESLEETKIMHNFIDQSYWQTDPLIPRPNIQKIYLDEVEVKSNYSNMEIVMGRNPGWESDVAYASNG